MKIVFLSRRFEPDIGGVEKHVCEISKRLIEKGHEVSVITETPGDRYETGRIKIIRISKSRDNWFKKFHIWNWLWQNRIYLKQADIIHAHDVYFWYWPFKLLFPGKKSFVTFHGYENYPIKRSAILSRKLSEFLANGNIVVGEFITKWYGTKPKYIIYGAVEIPSIKHKIPNKIKSDSAIFVGRLDDQTGVLEYAKAVDLIKKEYPNFQFKILGDGKYKNKLKRFTPIGFSNNPNDYLKQYEFAFVSRYLSILEALACKRLVFALYDNPVKEDYLKMSPFAKYIIIEKSAEALTERVLYFLKNPKNGQRLTDYGYKWVKKQTWEDTVCTYIKLWSN